VKHPIVACLATEGSRHRLITQKLLGSFGTPKTQRACKRPEYLEIVWTLLKQRGRGLEINLWLPLNNQNGLKCPPRFSLWFNRVKLLL
jgi:hypothetical protein